MIRTHHKDSKLIFKSRIEQKYLNICNKLIPTLSKKRKYNLTISEKYNFVWYRVAKVGTRSILAKFDKLNIPLSAYHSIHCYLPYKKYENYFKFGFTRDPLNRFISAWKDKILNFSNKKNYFDLDSKLTEKMRDINFFIDCFLSDDYFFQKDIHFRHQSHLIDLNDIDFIGRLENFNNDFNYILKKLDIKNINKKIYHKNKTTEFHTDSIKSISRINREKLINYYYKDFSIFGYGEK